MENICVYSIFRDKNFKNSFKKHVSDESLDIDRVTISVIEYVNSMACMAAYYDAVTASHQCIVSQIAGLISRELDLDLFDQFGVVIGAKVHDVGKIPLYKELIQKQGKLTEHEYELVKTHTVVGKTILEQFSTPWGLEDYAWMHHERIDGSGYPQGLKGDEIPMTQRIVHAVDVYEALLANRPYRKSLTRFQALDIINSEGHKFDPYVIGALEYVSELVPDIAMS